MLWPCGRRARAAPAATVTCPRSACPLPRLCSCLCCSSCFRSGGSLGGPSNNNNNNNIWPHYLRLDNYALPGTRAHTRSQVRCPVNDDAAPHVDCGTRNNGTARGQSRSSAVATPTILAALASRAALALSPWLGGRRDCGSPFMSMPYISRRAP